MPHFLNLPNCRWLAFSVDWHTIAMIFCYAASKPLIKLEERLSGHAEG